MFLYIVQYKADFPFKDVSEGDKTAMEKDVKGDWFLTALIILTWRPYNNVTAVQKVTRISKPLRDIVTLKQSKQDWYRRTAGRNTDTKLYQSDMGQNTNVGQAVCNLCHTEEHGGLTEEITLRKITHLQRKKRTAGR